MQIYAYNAPKYVWRAASARTRLGAYSAPPDALAKFKGPTSKKGEGKGRGEETESKGKRGERKGRARHSAPPTTDSFRRLCEATA